ncbi:MAG: outer membrane beta-barrel protein [Rikenellaceae bacterium]
MKRKTLITLAVLLLTTLNLFAQSGNAKGVVTDADTGQAVIGAVVEISSATNPEDKTYYSTDVDGAFVTARLSKGEYNLGITFLGYNNVVKSFSVTSGTVTIPPIAMTLSSTEIEAVVKVVKAIRASQKGDTLNYSASSFKVAVDADVENLIQKMPGITIEDGTVSAQGEEVTKIFVDGKEFFGSDVATALKSLPAEVVANIEVYDKLSDNAELSGVDDGDSSKAINIVTHKSMRKGVFGKLYAGYAYEPSPSDGVDPSKYLVGGNLNLFDNARRLSVIFLFNNLNQTNFSFEDIMGTSDDSDSSSSSFMVKNQPGVSVVNAIGLNYSDTFGEKDKVKLQASYFYNGTNTYNEKELTKWYDDPEYMDQTVAVSDTRNLNHRLNGRVDWKINESQSVMIRPSISFQSNDPFTVTTGERSGDGYSVSDGYTDGYRDISSMSDGFWSGFNVSTGVNYRAKLDSKGRLITFSGYYSLNDYSNDYDWQDYTYSKVDDVWEATARYQNKDVGSLNQKIKGDLMYMEPLSQKWSLSVNYKYENTYQEANTTTYTTDDNFENLVINTDGTSLSDSRYDVNKAGVGFRYAKEKTNFVVKGYYENSLLSSNVVNSDGSDSPSRRFSNFTYFSMANINFNQENSMKFRLNSYTSNPAISKLQDIYNIGNYMTKGNPDLDPSYSNRFYVQYTRSNLEKGSTFMIMGWARLTMNNIGNHIVYDPGEITIESGGETTTYEPLQYTTYANLDNYWEFSSRFTYGFPISLIKSNFNIGAGVSYSIEPSIIGGEVQSDGSIEGGDLTNSDNWGYTVNATLGSNISENVDFTFKWSGKYNIATTSTSAYGSSNEYFSQSASANMKFVLPLKFTLTASATYNQYLGFTDDYNDQSLVCNLFVGKKVFKNSRGEVLAGVCDLLDQNSSFNRSTGTNYSQNYTNSVIGRYFTVQFIYNLRYFGKNASTNMNDYKIQNNDDRRGPE